MGHFGCGGPSGIQKTFQHFFPYQFFLSPSTEHVTKKERVDYGHSKMLLFPFLMARLPLPYLYYFPFSTF
jgi:hypothetical protein